MKWFDAITLPKYISDLETMVVALRKKTVEQYDDLETLKKQFQLLQDEVNGMKQTLTAQPQENEIEEKEPDEVDLTGDEDFRVPMMDGMNLQFEGEDKKIPLKIYGSGSSGTKTN